MIFAQKAGYLLLEEMKKSSGCQLCKRQNDPLELTFYGKQGPLDDDDVILMDWNKVVGGPGIVCLACIIKIKALKIPPIRRKPTELV